MATNKEYQICLVAIPRKNILKNRIIMQQAEHGLTFETRAINSKEICALLAKLWHTLEAEDGLQAE